MDRSLRPEFSPPDLDESRPHRLTKGGTASFERLWTEHVLCSRLRGSQEPEPRQTGISAVSNYPAGKRLSGSPLWVAFSLWAGKGAKNRFFFGFFRDLCGCFVGQLPGFFLPGGEILAAGGGGSGGPRGGRFGPPRPLVYLVFLKGGGCGWQGLHRVATRGYFFHGGLEDLPRATV